MLTAVPAPQRATPRPSGRGLLLFVLLAGVGGGVLTEILQGVLVDPWAAWANSVAVWCGVGFAVGATARGPRVAAAAAVATEMLLVSAYYGAQVASGLPLSPSTVMGWLVAGVVAGIAFGLAGWAWRQGDARWSVAGAALLGGVLVAEGWVRAVRFPWQGSSGVVMIGVGVALVLTLGRTWRQRLAGVGLLAIVVPLGWAGIELVDALFARF